MAEIFLLFCSLLPIYILKVTATVSQLSFEDDLSFKEISQCMFDFLIFHESLCSRSHCVHRGSASLYLIYQLWLPLKGRNAKNALCFTRQDIRTAEFSFLIGKGSRWRYGDFQDSLCYCNIFFFRIKTRWRFSCPNLSWETAPNINLTLFPQRKNGRRMEMFSSPHLVLFPQSKNEVCFQTGIGFPWICTISYFNNIFERTGDAVKSYII